MRLARLLPWLLAVALATIGSRAEAQSFGKNKVHYEALDWAVIETPHLRLHYYAAEETLARGLAAFAESVAVEFDGRLKLEPKSKVPLLLYSTHHLFQQTNATPSLIGESTGGLTELIKGRVLVPHNGSWARLRWVTRHELAHWYMLEKMRVVLKEHRKPQSWMPDLWWVEGFAEFMGTTWDADAEGLLRDMVLTRNAYPLTLSAPITGSVMMYKEGQAFMLWLAERYGEERIFELLENVWRADDFYTAFQITYGAPLATVDQEWFQDLERRYFPAVATTSRAREVARPWPQDSRFNLAPRALAPATPGDSALRFCWFEVTDESVDLMVSEPVRDSLRRVRRLLRGGTSASFESFHLFQNRPSTSASGLIAVTAKRGGRDALYLIDPKRGMVIRQHDFPDLVAIHNPALAPDGKSVVFAAQGYDGNQDLYRASWPKGKAVLERITRDAYDDRQPAYSPDGKWLAFRSTRSGTSDLWVRPAEPSREARRVTRLQGVASDPDWLPDGRGLLFTAQEAVTFRTWSIAFNPDSLTA